MDPPPEKRLGDILYADKSKVRVSEDEWLKLLRAIGVGDQGALHSLYEQTHRIVFTLIVRITMNRETAEEVTLDVFYDVCDVHARNSCRRYGKVARVEMLRSYRFGVAHENGGGPLEHQVTKSPCILPHAQGVMTQRSEFA